MIIAVLSFGLLTAQEDLVETTNRVAELDISDNILEAFGRDLSEFDEEENEETYNKSFTVSNEDDLFGMFSDLATAREDLLVSQAIWDNFGVGKLIHVNIVNGRIDTDTFVGDLPGGSKGDFTSIGSEYAGKKNRPGSGYGNRNDDLMNPGGGIKDGGAFGGFNGRNGQHSYGGGSWDVNATHSSHKHSDGNGTTSFIHHHSSVSNDSGYSSETDKQAFKRADGSSTTRTVYTQTSSDGSTKSSVRVTETDKDGNSHTTITYTAKDSDGEVTEQRTGEENDPPKDDDNYNPEDPDGYYENVEPSEEEKESAVWRAVINNGIAGGTGDDRTGQSDRNEMSGDFSPMELQNQKGYMEPKIRGGKTKVNTGALVNPGRKD